jgi:DNA-binding transcriptional regulator YhcF (GntR family)
LPSAHLAVPARPELLGETTVRIVPDTGDPRKYVQISEILEAQIALGVLEPGESVTVSELVEEFKVSRQTARRALRVIEERELVACCGTAGFVVTLKCPTCGQRRQKDATQQ